MYTNLVEFTLHPCDFLDYLLGGAIGVCCFSPTIADHAMLLGSGNTKMISTLVHCFVDNKTY
jgi:hypothetical protein